VTTIIRNRYKSITISLFYNFLGKAMQKNSITNTSVRLDKWLWAARFFKTRALAKDAVQSGKVQYQGKRCKPSRVVELGANVKVPQGYDVKEVVVLQLQDKRLAAVLAESLYQETEDSQKHRANNAQARKLNALISPRPDHRPNKKQRRQIIQFKQQ
jgi:ribosome-associated heat shock protein Hsp15